MLAADFVVLLIPLWIALGLLFLIVAFGLLARVQNGRYVRPIVVLMMKKSALFFLKNSPIHMLDHKLTALCMQLLAIVFVFNGFHRNLS